MRCGTFALFKSSPRMVLRRRSSDDNSVHIMVQSVEVTAQRLPANHPPVVPQLRRTATSAEAQFSGLSASDSIQAPPSDRPCHWTPSKTGAAAAQRGAALNPPLDGNCHFGALWTKRRPPTQILRASTPADNGNSICLEDQRLCSFPTSEHGISVSLAGAREHRSNALVKPELVRRYSDTDLHH